MSSLELLFGLCEYETPIVLQVKSRFAGLLSRFLQLTIVCYIIGYAIVWKKGYQEISSLNSVVVSKVHGVAFTNCSKSNTDVYNRIWDPADYVVPTTGMEDGSFFVMTNPIITPNQTRSACAENHRVEGSVCNSNTDCKKGKSLPNGNGVMTGKCVPFPQNSSNIKTCEILAWCPVQQEKATSTALLEESKQFTVFIKNFIEFPKFGKQYQRRNILETSNSSYLTSCLYHHATDPFCPIFRLGDIVSEAGHQYNEVAKKGAIFVIWIKWFCNLDYDFHRYCLPKYEFERLDRIDAVIAPGWNYRIAEFHEGNRRTLIKSYGIKFVIRVEGQARKFNMIPLFINVGSGLALLGLASLVTDLVLLYLHKSKHYYRGKKYKVASIPREPGNMENICPTSEPFVT